jgi:hypothetical protein
MNGTANVIWRQGDGAMPPKVEHVVEAARSEMIFRSLQLSEDTVNAILYNSEKNEQTVSEYIADLLTQRLKSA